MSNTTTPNIPNIATWIEALESGTYKQGKGQLRKDDQFCCLGVACDLAGEDWVKRTIDADCFSVPFVDQADGVIRYQVAALTPKAIQWLGVGSGMPSLQKALVETPVGGISALAGANDNGATFEDIAAALRVEFDIPKEAKPWEPQVGDLIEIVGPHPEKFVGRKGMVVAIVADDPTYPYKVHLVREEGLEGRSSLPLALQEMKPVS